MIPLLYKSVFRCILAITYYSSKELEPNDIRELFHSVHWSVGDNPDKLKRAFGHSDKVITAWDGERLIGLINSVADGELTAFIPYLLVNPDYQQRGIGKNLVMMIKEEYANYERIVLLTENDTIGFYRKSGFQEAPSIHSMIITH